MSKNFKDCVSFFLNLRCKYQPSQGKIIEALQYNCHVLVPMELIVYWVDFAVCMHSHNYVEESKCI